MKKRVKKIWLIILLSSSVIFSVIWIVIGQLDYSHKGSNVKFGVTFSYKYASQDLGLDWTEVYWNIINDLGVKNIRLAVPWDLLEERNGEYNFADVDWMVEEAGKKDINIILAIGRKTPRWPECHDPAWLAELPKNRQDEELLAMLEKTVKHFQKYKNISMWQVENEPLLGFFGDCPNVDVDLLKKEIALVKSLDDRNILITDTGELSNWAKAASLGDVFGVTMYKVVWNKFIGVWRYPWPPAYYYYKSQRVKQKYDLDKVIVAELQAEPWVTGADNILEMPLIDQLSLFSYSDLASNLVYAKKAGFDEVYLWGVEWWYWLAKEKNHPEFWENMKLIWQN